MMNLHSLSALAAQFLAERGPGTPPDPAVLRAQAEYAGVPESARDSLCELASLVASDPALTALYSGLLDLSCMEEYHEQTAGPMQALVLFGALPAAREKHAALGIPVQISSDTFHCLACALEEYADQNEGAFGIRYYIWLRNHLKAELFQVGRLQYMLTPFTGYARVFANDSSGEVILTCREGIAFNGDGRTCLTDGNNSASGNLIEKNQVFPEGSWKSEYAEDTEKAAANCLFVNGRAIRTQVLLDKAVWRQVLQEGLFRLEVHIPSGARLNSPECTDSMQKAWQFFHKYFPDRPFETFTCNSWLLETEMQNFLPPSSGIIQFQKLFRLYPTPGTGRSFISRVFGVDPETAGDIKEFARTADSGTGLRRGMAGYWLAGGNLRETGGIIHQYDLIRSSMR